MRNPRPLRWASSACGGSRNRWRANCRRRAFMSRILSSMAVFAAQREPSRRTGRTRCSIPMPLRWAIGASCNSRAVPGAGKSNCGHGSRSFDTTVIPGRPQGEPGMTQQGATRMTTETTIDTGTDELLCVIRDRVAIITLNRPEVRNALSDDLSPALRNMIRTCGENPDVGVLLLTGAGSAFCAGGNVKGMGALRDKAKLAMPFDDRVADLQERQRLLTGALV